MPYFLPDNIFIYNRQWIDSEIHKIKQEEKKLEELRVTVLRAYRLSPPERSFQFKQVLQNMDKLELSLRKTRIALEHFYLEMEHNNYVTSKNYEEARILTKHIFD